MIFRHTVLCEEDGNSLKNALRNTLRLSATQIRRLKAADAIFVNGDHGRMGQIIRCGDNLEVIITEPEPSFPAEDGAPLTVLFEDEHLLVVDKPQGIILHPTHSRLTGTLANRAWEHIRAAGGDGCHAVNRLDRDTGGIVIFAKNAWACFRMTGAVTDKRYLAVVCGTPESESGTIDSPIRLSSDISMKRICADDGQQARTDWQLLRHQDGLSLLELRLYTGRTHQIRVHCASIGLPLLGDRLYGTESSLAKSAEIGAALHALWCYKTVFLHPVDDHPVTLTLCPTSDFLSYFDF